SSPVSPVTDPPRTMVTVAARELAGRARTLYPGAVNDPEPARCAVPRGVQPTRACPWRATHDRTRSAGGGTRLVDTHASPRQPRRFCAEPPVYRSAVFGQVVQWQ